MSAPRKYAIAGNVGETVLYWTGAKRRSWTTLESRAKKWRSDSIAATWLKQVPLGLAMSDLRVLEVAP